MSRNPVRLMLKGLVLLLLLHGGLAAGQEGVRPEFDGESSTVATPSSRDGSSPSASTARDATPPWSDLRRIEESRPREYYLRDKNGNLQVILGLSFEEFERAWRLANRIDQTEQRPRYVIQRLLATGEASKDHASLNIEIELRTFDHRLASVEEAPNTSTSDLDNVANWLQIPLHLDQAVLLRESVEHEGDGDFFLSTGPEGEEGQAAGYVARICGKPGQHRITMSVLVPLRRSGEETQLHLYAPRATASELRLKVPVPGAVGEVSEWATLQSSQEADNGHTELVARGLGGNFKLSWHAPRKSRQETATVLETQGSILAKIDKRGVDTTAMLTVRGYDTSFDCFQVRLPPGARWVPSRYTSRYTSYTITPVDDGMADPSGRQSVEVRLAHGSTAKPATGEGAPPVEIELTTRRAHPPNGPGKPFELASFDVVGAVHQWGNIAVVADDDVHVRWNGSRDVHRIAPSELAASLRQDGLIAGFEYVFTSEPCSLTASIEGRKTRIKVEPRYTLLVDEDRIGLLIKLKYSVRGAKAHELYVDMRGWKLESVEQPHLIRLNRENVDVDNMLTLPLETPTTGPLEIDLQAYWPSTIVADSLPLPLPTDQHDTRAHDTRADVVVGPATVVIAPNDNVELTLDHERTKGLTKQPLPPRIKPFDDRQQTPLFFQADADRAKVAFDYRVPEQQIEVESSGHLNLVAGECQVQQELDYTIKYQAINHVVLDIPSDVLESETLRIECGGKVVVPTAIPGSNDGNGSSATARRQIDLPTARFGTCRMTLNYSVPVGPMVAGKMRDMSVPLIMPASGELRRNVVQIISPPTMDVAIGKPDESPSTETWKIVQSIPKRHSLRLTAEKKTSSVAFTSRLIAEENVVKETTIVERAWVQTWLTDRQRQDRVVYSFTSNRKELHLTMPAGRVAEMSISLNEKPLVAKSISSDGLLIVPLGTDGRQTHYCLEISSSSPRGKNSSRGRVFIEVPEIADDAWVRHTYWQLILPRSEHVIASPNGFTNEFSWGWDGYYWGRRPLLSQEELERWVGVSSILEPKDVNCYLFSSLGHQSVCEIRIASRWSIVLLASGASLVFGLILIYVPMSRHPAVLLLGAITLMAVGILHPGPALLAAQAASLGLLLSLMPGILEKVITRRRRGLFYPDASSAIREQGSTQTPSQLSAGGSHATSTLTSPPAVISPDATPPSTTLPPSDPGSQA